jgi:hypothetical protein
MYIYIYMGPYTSLGINLHFKRITNPSTQLLNGSVQKCSNFSIKSIVIDAQKPYNGGLQDVIHRASSNCIITFPSNASLGSTSVGATSVGATSGCCYTVSSNTSSCPKENITYYNPCTQSPSPLKPLCVTYNGCV